MESGKTVTAMAKGRMSIEALGLVLPVWLWVPLLFIDLGACVVQLFVPDTEAHVLRLVAFGVMMFIAGIVFAFKLPLWAHRNTWQTYRKGTESNG